MAAQELIPIERIASRIYLIRGREVVLDSDLAKLYGVSTAKLNRQVKRNIERFPPDFVFQLNEPEFAALMSQMVISNHGRGSRRKPPWVFNEQGAAMLSSVLHSSRTIAVNLAIMRAFVSLRHILASNGRLARQVEKHDPQIGLLFEIVDFILSPPGPKRRPIGLITPRDKSRQRP